MSINLFSQKALIEHYLKKRSVSHSAFSFANIFAWNDFFEFSLEEIDGNLCVFAKNNLGTFLYLPPLGEEISKNAIQFCFDKMRRENQGSGVTRIENVLEEDLGSFKDSKFSIVPKSDEYLYKREDTAFLKGNRFKSKKAEYHYFLKNFSFEFLPFEETMLKACEGLYEDWAKTRRQFHQGDLIYCQMLEDNALVHRRVLARFRDLNLIGRVVLIDGKLSAYTAGYPVNPDVFCVLFEITDLTKKGLSTFIFKELCADKALERFSYMNGMDDFGLSNLTKTKMSFRPCQMISSFVVSERKVHV